MSVDLRATFLFPRAAALVMKRAGSGRIINFADWVAASGRPRYPGFLPYYVAKAGVMRSDTVAWRGPSAGCDSMFPTRLRRY